MSETTDTRCHLGCGKPAGTDAYVCKDCTAEARDDLGLIADLMVHVDHKRARWGAADYTRWSVPPKEQPAAEGPRARGHRAHSSDTGLPYDPRVTKVVHPILVGLRGTHDVLAEKLGWHDALTHGNAPTVARWIRDRLDTLRAMPEGPEEMRFLSTAASDLSRLLDRPPDRLYLGQCGTVHTDPDDGEVYTCTAYVYAERKKTLDPFAACPRCHASIDVTQRRDQFQDAVRLYQATRRELDHLAPLLLAEPVSPRTIGEWMRHGLLRPVGQRKVQTATGAWRDVPTYRIGDLEPAAAAWAVRVEERRTARRATA